MFTLSIILNLHREGDLAAKTILNLRNILKEPHNWKNVEVITVLDNADRQTKQVIYTNKDLFAKIEEVDYKDLGDSRNHGVAASTNNFILFADGDDYCSHNTLQAIYDVFHAHYSKIVTELEQLPENEHIAVFPKYLIEFPNLFQMRFVNSNNFIVENNKFVHCYISKISAPRNLLVKHKIRRNTPPYGYEDWDLNNRLLYMGVKYKIADYKFYYRRENSQSLLAKQVSQKHIVRNSPIFSYEHHHNTIAKQRNNVLESNENCNDDTYEIFRHKPSSKFLNELYHRILFEDDEKFLSSYGDTFTYREDIICQSSKDKADHLLQLSKIYSELLDFFHKTDIVYFSPWITLGGADKVTLEYTKAVAEKKACLVTSIASGTRIDRLNIPHLDLVTQLDGWEHISEEDQMHVLLKALINSEIKVVHIINSYLALQIVKYYGEVFKENSIEIMISLFCPDYDWNKNIYHGYPVMFPEIYNYSSIVLSDNNKWYSFYKEVNKGKDFNYNKLASPTQPMKLSYQYKKQNTNKILWASRLCNQKLFEVFEKIVNQLPEYQFVIYGGEPEDQNNKEILERLLTKPNFEFRGEYQHISELDLKEFDLYLFTSLFEGIPTIILDMAMSGIPIVSANVGGISEVLGQDYSLLVNNTRDPQAYIEKINEFYQNKTSIASKMKKIRQYIIDTHNEKTFQNEYQTIIKGLLDGHR